MVHPRPTVGIHHTHSSCVLALGYVFLFYLGFIPDKWQSLTSQFRLGSLQVVSALGVTASRLQSEKFLREISVLDLWHGKCWWAQVSTCFFSRLPFWTSARVLVKMAGLEEASVGFHARVHASGRASWHGKCSGTDLQICSSVRLALHAKLVLHTSISI